MKLRQFFLLLFLALLAHEGVEAEQSAPRSIVLASTTSVENSGLLAHILPLFTKKTGITVHVLAQGTGQALQTAARNDADLVLVHDPEAEQKFIAAGDGIERRQIAWNDFIVVGPRSDPAHIAGGRDAIAALRRSPRRRRPLCRAATGAARTRSNTASGVQPGSIPPKPAADRGIATSAAAWARR
jgi:tungstate transport system substrate-binding protein